MTDEKFCRKCIHCVGTGWHMKYGYTCDYFLHTGNRRPCPPGSACTVREIGRRRKPGAAEVAAIWGHPAESGKKMGRNP